MSIYLSIYTHFGFMLGNINSQKYWATVLREFNASKALGPSRHLNSQWNRIKVIFFIFFNVTYLDVGRVIFQFKLKKKKSFIFESYEKFA